MQPFQPSDDSGGKEFGAVWALKVGGILERDRENQHLLGYEQTVQLRILYCFSEP